VKLLSQATESGSTRRRFVEGLALVEGGASAGRSTRQRRILVRKHRLEAGSISRLEQDRSTSPAARASQRAVNGSVPAPLLRFRTSETVAIGVTNRLDEPASIHWHGIKPPNATDGVLGLIFKGQRKLFFCLLCRITAL